MEKLIYHSLTEGKYSYIITVLDYEIRVSKLLSELSFPLVKGSKGKAIVDLALKTGVNRYRFVEIDLDREGRIIPESDNYVLVSKDIEEMANRFLQEKKDIVLQSILTDTKKREVLSFYMEHEII